jgi:hypothetical protein
MIDGVFKALQGGLASQLQQQFQLTPGQAGQSVDTARDTVTNTLIGELTKGDIGQIASLFQGKGDLAKNPLVLSMIQTYGSDLAAKVGIPANVAQQVSQFAIPFIMGQFTQKASGTPMDEIARQLASEKGGELLKGLTGKLPGGLGGALGGFFK